MDRVYAISYRPRMYTRHGAFWECVAYVDGFAAAVGSPVPEYFTATGFGHEMRAFQIWLANKYEVEEINWADLLLQACDGDELRAIAALGPLFKSFLEESGCLPDESAE